MPKFIVEYIIRQQIEIDADSALDAGTKFKELPSEIKVNRMDVGITDIRLKENNEK